MNAKINVGSVSIGNKIRRALWNVACFFLFRPCGTKVFHLWRIFLLRLFGAEVDWSAEVYASAEVWAPWLLTMQAGSCLGPHTIIYNQARVTLGRDVTVSQYAYLCTAGHETNDVNNAQTGLIIAPIIIAEKAWIGTRAFVGMGVEVGASAVIGACACVFKDVEAHAVVGGNPAQVIKKMN